MEQKNGKYRVGVDLGGTNIAVGLVNEAYEIVARKSVPTRAPRPAEEIVADMAAAVDDVLRQAGVGAEQCAAIGIGAPGICKVESGVVARSYSLSWQDVPVCALLAQHFPRTEIRLDNDANCAALAEVRAGAARGCQSAVLVTLGTGIGTGIVLGGSIYSGKNGSGTEFGHTMLLLDGELCFCGRRGCWDAYASATALILQAKRAAAARPESALNLLPEITGKGVFLAAKNGDVAAKAVIKEYCRYLAVGVSNIVNALAPEMVLLGGGVGRQADILIPPIEQCLREQCFDKREEAMPVIRQAALGNDAGIIGAAVL